MSFDLILYEAFINTNNYGGEFVIKLEQDKSTEYYLKSMKEIMFCMTCYRGGINIKGMRSLVNNVDNGEYLVDFAAKNIQQCSPRIDILARQHGKIHFTRKITFTGKKEDVIRVMESSNYLPKLSSWNQLLYKGLYDDRWQEKYKEEHPLGPWDDFIKDNDN